MNLIKLKSYKCLASFLLLLFACRFLVGCSESNFDLAPESRIPKWFNLPPQKSRADVNVTLDYYVMPWGRRAEFKMWDKNGNKLAEVTGSQKGNAPIKLSKRNPEFPEGYPSYEIITADKVTEVIEHRRMEPIFYINDDPSVHSELGVR